MKVLVNVGGFEWRRTTGDHAQLYYEHPTNENDRRHVTVPLHDELRTGPLRDIAESAGANDVGVFCAWVDQMPDDQDGKEPACRYRMSSRFQSTCCTQGANTARSEGHQLNGAVESRQISA